jgi:hypothetical protein
MVEPIGNTSPISPSLPESNIPLLSKQLQASMGALSSHLSELKIDPSLASQPEFLQAFAANASQLKQSIHSAQLC